MTVEWVVEDKSALGDAQAMRRWTVTVYTSGGSGQQEVFMSDIQVQQYLRTLWKAPLRVEAVPAPGAYVAPGYAYGFETTDGQHIVVLETPTRYRRGAYPVVVRALHGVPDSGLDWVQESVGVGAGDCYGVPGYSDCTNKSFADAQKTCYAQQAAAQADPNGPAGLMWQSQFGGVLSNCNSYYNAPGIQACRDQFCPKDQPATTYPWGVVSTETKNLQEQLNTKLAQSDPPKAPNGYNPINDDGKLGPATCGAAQVVWPEMEPQQCAGHEVTLPTPKTTPGNQPPPPPPKTCPDTPCAADKDCVAGDCVDKCPSGQSRDANGNCVTTTSSAGGGSTWGLALLGAGAAAALFFGLRASDFGGNEPKPAHHQRPKQNENPRRKRRRNRRAA